MMERHEGYDGCVTLGPYYSEGYLNDVKKSMITLARYKFASKLLEYKEHTRVLELGCNEGMGAFFFMQMPGCEEYIGVDLDEEKLEWANRAVRPYQEKYQKKVRFCKGDIVSENAAFYEEGGTAVICLDVIEHIAHEKEEQFMHTIVNNLEEDGVAIIGTPNLTMKQYQSDETQKQHINMFDAKRLYKLMSSRFRNVFMFGMSDEVVHTGFMPMNCYLFALCCSPVRGGGAQGSSKKFKNDSKVSARSTDILYK